MVRPAQIDLNPDEHYCSFINSLDWCGETCNTAEGPFGRLCVCNKVENFDRIFH